MATRTLLAVDADHGFARCGDLVVVLWAHETTLPAVAEMRRQMFDIASDRHDPLLLLTVVRETAPAPGNAARKAVGALLSEMSGYIRASAVVFEGTGLRASFVRSIVSTLTLMARPGFPHRVFPDLDGALDLYAQHGADLGLDLAALRSDAEALIEGIVREIHARRAGAMDAAASP